MQYVRHTYFGNTLHPTAVKSFSSQAPILNRQKRNATKANSWPANIKEKQQTLDYLLITSFSYLNSIITHLKQGNRRFALAWYSE